MGHVPHGPSGPTDRLLPRCDSGSTVPALAATDEFAAPGGTGVDDAEVAAAALPALEPTLFGAVVFGISLSHLSFHPLDF